MENEIASTLVGAVLPVVVDFVNNKVNNVKVKYLVALLISMLTGAIVTYLTSGFHSMEELVANIGLVFAAGQTVYMTYWKQSSARSIVLARGART